MNRVIIYVGKLISITTHSTSLLDPLELMEWADFREFCIVFLGDIVLKLFSSQEG